MSPVLTVGALNYVETTDRTTYLLDRSQVTVQWIVNHVGRTALSDLHAQPASHSTHSDEITTAVQCSAECPKETLVTD